ncbi:hypothetical protein P8452_52477 [Trifolium repens]|nr:hypothetical protein P8452_52477 [Trifolium repens]
MKKTNQTKKTKDLDSMPNFSLGLTPSEEEGEMKDKKADEYLDHYKGCIRIYNGAVQTLERRIAEESVGTSAKQHAISQEQKGVEIAETEEPGTKGEDDEGEDGESENGESDDTESDDAGGNSDVERVNNDDESDEDEDAKTISAEPRAVEVAESKEAEAETESRAGAETEVGESSDAQSFHNFLIQT